jgi:hypothetical protein
MATLPRVTAWSPTASVEFHVFGIGALRGRTESRQRVLGAHDAEIVLAFAEPEASALRARVIGKRRGHIADLPSGSAGFHDLAREFMTQNGAVRHHENAGMGRVQVGAADAAIVDLQNDLPGSGLGLGDVLDGERSAQFVEYGGFHGSILPLISGRNISLDIVARVSYKVSLQ